LLPRLDLASNVDFIQPLQLQLDRNPLSPQQMSIFLRPIPRLCPCTITTSMQIRETLDHRETVLADEEPIIPYP
jgi:hypothetical protein